jgi:hypothetical protein
VLNDDRAIANILAGTITEEIENDLKSLIRRPLILRTDSTDIPSDKREMLPRSDELRSYEDARNWLLETFASKIKQGSLESANLCLIGHHFIPSIASAWARAFGACENQPGDACQKQSSNRIQDFPLTI